MNKFTNTTILLSLLVLAIGLGGCLVEDVELDVVLNEDVCAVFPEDEDHENYTSPRTVELGASLDSLLADNEVTRDDIADAFVVSATYEVVEFSQDHDWDITGAITVERADIADGPDTLVIYTDQPVNAAIVGDVIGANLHGDGVALLGRALDDFIAGGNPSLTFTVVSGDVEPDPSPGDKLVFTWDACVLIQVIYTMESEKFEPF